jgi:hypothetical protein
VARSRDSTMQAGCSLQATRLVSSTRRPVGSATTPESRTPRTWPGSCGSGAPRPGWSRTRATRYTYHTMNGTRLDCSLYAAGLCPVRLPHGSRCRGAPLIDYGAVTMDCYRGTARRPYSARRRTSRRCSPKEL